MDLTVLAPAEQAQLAGLLAKMSLQPAPAAKAKKPRKPDTVKYWTQAETEAFFRAIDSPRDYAMYRVIYHRGLRASEVGKLQLSDYLVSRDRITITRLKGSHGGEYHLTSREVRALKAWLKARGGHPGPLFPSQRGKGISQQMLDVLTKRYCAKAGIPREKAHTHALKHSCATHILDAGFSIEDCQDHLGHVSVSSTQVYAKYTNSRRQERDRRLRDW